LGRHMLNVSDNHRNVEIVTFSLVELEVAQLEVENPLVDATTTITVSLTRKPKLLDWSPN